MHSRSYLQNTPTNYSLAYHAGSRAAHSIWLLSWQSPNGQAGGGVGLMRGSLVRLAQWNRQSPTCWHEFREFLGDLKPPAGGWRDKGRKKDKKGGGVGTKGGSGKAPEVWFGAETEGGGRRSCKNTVWRSEGELLDLQLTVYTQTRTCTLAVHARPYAPKTFRHLPRLSRVLR